MNAPRTGEKSIATATYLSSCGCSKLVELRRNETAPRCPRCSKEVRWKFLESRYLPRKDRRSEGESA